MLAKLIRDSFNDLISEVHVCMPARIEKYDPDTMVCSAQPLIKRRFYNKDSATAYPIINKVPVVFNRTATALIRLPVSVGDIVTLVFSDHEISNWVNSTGDLVEYLDKRYHHINDCFALPGGYPIGKPHTAVNKDALEIVVSPGTKITIGNETDELLQIAYDSFTSLKSLTDRLSETLTSIGAITVTCPNGGGLSTTPVNAANFASTKGQVDAISSEITAELDRLNNIKV